MNARLLPILLALSVVLAACNLSAPNGPTAPPVIPTDTQPAGGSTALPSDTPTLQPSDTPIPSPTNTPTFTFTPTFSTAMVTPATEDVNCRLGPGVNYLTTGGLKAGASVPILGQNGDGTWWQIQNPNNIIENCWVSSSATVTSGNLASVPVAPSPQVLVTAVVANTPETVTGAACVPGQPIILTGTITTNGPVAVTWHFETQQEGALPSHTVNVTKFGPVTVTESGFSPSLVAGTYWLKLFVTAPNSLTAAEASYTISCP